MSEVAINYDESLAGDHPLPSALLRPTGGRVSSAVEWYNRRRPEILADFERIMYGKIPPRPETVRPERLSEVTDALGGKATRREIRLHMEGPCGVHFLDILWYLPNHVNKPVGAIAGINFQGNAACTNEDGIRPTVNFKSEAPQQHRWQIPMLIDAGFSVATCCRNDLFPDRADGRAESIYKMFHPASELGAANRDLTAISAWAFGCSRLLDLLETEPRIDARRIWVHGHSRLGKTALWAAANDSRFAGAVSNDSGCCGAALDRRDFGETIAKITETFPWWFPAALDAYAETPAALPSDQHMLIGLIAPRPVLVASATEDLWADPRGEFLSARAAGEIYRLFGSDGISGCEFPAPETPVFGDGVGYYLRTGKHDVTATDWKFVLEFIRRTMTV